MSRQAAFESVAIERLKKIAREMADDPERAHSAADAALLELVDIDVREAYQEVVDACRWWATA